MKPGPTSTLNRLRAEAAKLPAPCHPGEWRIVSPGVKFESVATPGGLAWRTVASMEFPVRPR